MKRMRFPSLVALVLLAFGSGLPARAQQVQQEPVAFKATLAGPIPVVGVVPIEPPRTYASLDLVGKSELMGDIRLNDHHGGEVGIDGVPKSAEGIGVVTGANGDTFFFRWRGLVRPGATPGVFVGENVFYVTGGRGRFQGASGSGAFNWIFDGVEKKQVSASMEGMILLARAQQ